MSVQLHCLDGCACAESFLQADSLTAPQRGPEQKDIWNDLHWGSDSGPIITVVSLGNCRLKQTNQVFKDITL